MSYQSSVPQKILEYINNKQIVSINDLSEALDLTPRSASSYLSRLAQMGAIKSIGRGLYQIGKGESVAMRLSPDLAKNSQRASRSFSDGEVCHLVFANAFRLFALHDWERPHIYRNNKDVICKHA